MYMQNIKHQILFPSAKRVLCAVMRRFLPDRDGHAVFMEVLPNNPDSKDFVLGDVYFGYLVPTVLCGRSDAFRRDLCTFITKWLAVVFVSDIGAFLKVCV